MATKLKSSVAVDLRKLADYANTIANIIESIDLDDLTEEEVETWEDAEADSTYNLDNIVWSSLAEIHVTYEDIMNKNTLSKNELNDLIEMMASGIEDLAYELVSRETNSNYQPEDGGKKLRKLLVAKGYELAVSKMQNS